MRNVVICSAVRTAIGNFGGALSSVSVVELGKIVIEEALNRAGVASDKIDEVIMGNALQTSTKPNSARQAAVYAGIPVEVPSVAINKLCGSGLKAVNLGIQSIKAGDNELVIAGGMESMSNAPYALDKARFGYRMGDGKIHDTMLNDALICAFKDYHMGVTAENVAEMHGITREEQDEYALSSQQRAVAAINAGKFKEEIVPVTIKSKKGDLVVDTDEYPKADASLESLAKLRPAFKKDGTVTAGNASGVNDGAAAVLLASEDKAKELGLKPMAKILGYASSGIAPEIMGLAPVEAVKKALKNAGLTLDDIDYIEANEAFAAQFLGVGKMLNIDKSKANVHGGAIALGHPIGASGARVLVTLLHILKQNNAKYGLATLCIGGGQGVAIVVENI